MAKRKERTIAYHAQHNYKELNENIQQ